jgi:adenylate kinase family enzyme
VIGGAHRILVYGVTGSGKSVLAERIAAHAVDDLTWEPGWVQVPDAEQCRRIEAICAQREWILDSAYGKWLDVVLARVELIVALDYPRWFSLQRLVRRTARRAIDRRTVCNGNRESLRTAFSRDSIIRWHFRDFARKRDRIEQWAADPNGPQVVRLRSARQTKAWLAGLTATRSG